MMAIFSSTAPNTQTPDQAMARTLQRRIDQQFDGILRLFDQARSFVWEHPTLSPQQVLDLFGDKAARLFLASNACCAMVEMITGTPVQVLPAGWSYSINPDGTVTLTKAA